MKRILGLTGLKSGIVKKVVPEDLTSFRDGGDRARDSGDWSAASRYYAAHLELRHDDVAIWIQLGHALKESGHLSQAEMAYQNAARLDPNDADAFLHLGHSLKLQERFADSKNAYVRSLELAPSQSAYRELTSIGEVDQANLLLNKHLKTETQNVVFFEIDDLLGYLKSYKTLSGIQRVQVGIIRCILNLKQSDVRYVFVQSRVDGNGFWEIKFEDLIYIINYSTSPSIIQDNLVNILNRAEEHALPVDPKSGDSYVILGAFWGSQGQTARYANLKSKNVIVGVYIYDLIPLVYPEFCNIHLVSDFILSLGDGLASFDYILTISEYTAEQVRNLQNRCSLRMVPVKSVPLAHVLNDTGARTSEQNLIWTKNISAYQNRRFVMMVSTIEGRKNHAYLVSIWKYLLAEGLKLPDLIFVGRRGWRVNDFMEQLEATNYLDGHIHILHDLSDAELATLYKHCMFTAFPSFVEGWGLPVGESLAHGCPCIASNTTSIPEVGGDLVDYIDPLNVQNGVTIFKRMIFDDAYRAGRREEILRNFKGRQWSEVTENFLDQIGELRNARLGLSNERSPLLKAAELFAPGDFRSGQRVPVSYPSRPLRSILSGSWYAAERFGVWMQGTKGELRFRSDCQEGAHLAIYLKIATPPWSRGQKLNIHVVGASKDQQPMPFPRSIYSLQGDLELTANSQSWTCVSGVVKEGSVDINFLVTGECQMPENENRIFYIGLMNMLYCESENTKMRTDIVEQILFGQIRVNQLED